MNVPVAANPVSGHPVVLLHHQLVELGHELKLPSFIASKLVNEIQLVHRQIAGLVLPVVCLLLEQVLGIRRKMWSDEWSWLHFVGIHDVCCDVTLVFELNYTDLRPVSITVEAGTAFGASHHFVPACKNRKNQALIKY